MSVAIAGAAAVESADTIPPSVAPNRLRRMDRFARAGFLAGVSALREAGVERSASADPRAGVVFGTMYGCRDSIADHARLLATAKALEQLRPMLFAETVHNTVNGELAIEWNLGGVSEVIVSGRCAGLEALILAARRLEDGGADRLVAGAAEGIHADMRDAWLAERAHYGPRAAGVEIEECGVALVLERTASSSSLLHLAGGTSFFEPDPDEVAGRVLMWAAEILGDLEDLAVAAPVDLDGAFRIENLRGVPCTYESVERFGVSGPRGVLVAAELLSRREAEKAIVVTRDPEGPTAAVALRAVRAS